MELFFFKRVIVALSILLAVGHANVTLAHSAGGAIDAAGTNANATDLAAVTCYDDGDGPAAYLFVQIQDQSAPLQGLLMSIHIQKGLQMTTSTDAVSGDATASPGATLNGGNGIYYISATKTAAGTRIFTVTYHCMTSGNAHTGTDITLYQAQ